MPAPRPPRRQITASVLLVSALVLALGTGCFKNGFLNAGEHDKPSGEKARFITAVDPLCQDANDRVAALGQPPEPGARLAALRQSVTVRQELLAQLTERVPPRGGVDELKYQAFVASVRNLSSGLEGVALKLEIGDRAGAADLAADVELAARQTRESAAEFQFSACRTVVGIELARPA